MNSSPRTIASNRLGAFFAAMPDRDEAMRDLAQHVRRFWEPRMRRQLFEHLDERRGEGVDALVVAALQRHRTLFS